MTDREYATRKQAASLLGVSTRTIDRYATSGQLPKYRLLGQIVFLLEDVRELALPQRV